MADGDPADLIDNLKDLTINKSVPSLLFLDISDLQVFSYDQLSWGRAPVRNHHVSSVIDAHDCISSHDDILRKLTAIIGVEETDMEGWLHWRASVKELLREIISDLFEGNLNVFRIKDNFYIIYDEIHLKNAAECQHIIARNFPASTKKSLNSEELNTHEVAALEKAMASTVIYGQTHVLLKTQIENALMEEDSYADYFALINSSGTGKTRTALQLADLGVYVVYMCLRRAHNGFPLGTPFILNEVFNSDVEQNVQLLYAILSEKVAAAKEAAESPTTFLQKQKIKYGEAETNGFWISIRKMLEMRKKDHVASESGKLATSLPDKKRPKSGPLLDFVIVFDEIRTPFITLASDDFDTKLFENFRRGIKIFGEILKGQGYARPFTVLIDTTSRIGNIAPKKSNNSTKRVSGGKETLLQPFFHFDTFNAADLMSIEKCDGLNVGEKCCKKVASIIGRPLWAAYQDNLPEKLFQFARSKLICSGKKELEPGNHLQFLACVMARYCLNDVRTDIASELIASYMRVCGYISDDRTTIYTENVAEPILAKTAHSFLSDDFEKFIETLLHTIGQLKISIGDRGELSSQVLILRARDLASTDDFFRPILVREFLCELFGASFVAEFEKVDQRHQKVSGLSPILDAIVNVGYFIEIDYVPTVKDLMVFFALGAGVICKTGQKGVDKVLPCVKPVSLTKDVLDQVSGSLDTDVNDGLHYVDIAEPKSSNTTKYLVLKKGRDFFTYFFCEEHMSASLFQDKNCVSKKDKGYPNSATSKNSLYYSEIEQCPYQSYLSICWNLGYCGEPEIEIVETLTVCSQAEIDAKTMLDTFFPNANSTGQSQFILTKKQIEIVENMCQAVKLVLKVDCSNDWTKWKNDVTKCRDILNYDLPKTSSAAGKARSKAFSKFKAFLFEEIRRARQISIAVFGIDEQIFPCLSGGNLLEQFQQLARKTPKILEYICEPEQKTAYIRRTFPNHEPQ